MKQLPLKIMKFSNSLLTNMQTILAKLIDLAKDYRDYELLVGGVGGGRWSTLREGNSSTSIQVYVAEKGKTSSVQFGKVGVTLYRNSFELPFGFTEELLQSTYDDAKAYLIALVETKEDVYLDRIQERRQRIEKLETQLEREKSNII
jgi:hypothetical protein